MSDLYLPSYEQGFAPHTAEPAYPGLRNGLESAWLPPLGPTGLTLRDIGGRGKHGTLENVDPATVWVMTEKSWALDLDGINDLVNCGSIHVDHLSACIWFNSDRDFDTMSADRYLFSIRENSASVEWQIFARQDIDDIRFRLDTAGGNTNLDTTMSGSWETDRWYFFVATYDGVTSKIYIDGSLHVETAHAFGGNIKTVASAVCKIGDMNGGVATGRWDGRFGPVALYNRALTLREIQFLYGKPMAIAWPRAKVFPGAAAAPPAGNRRRRLILLGA